VTARRDLALASIETGDVLAQIKKWPDADQRYRKSRDLLLALLREDPQNEQYQRDLNSALEPLARTLSQTGQIKEARQRYGDLLNGLRPLLERTDPSPYDLHLYCWAMVNTSFKDLYNSPDVLRLAQKAEELTRRSPDPAILNVLALAWADNNDFAQATETERRALALAQSGTKRTEIEHNLALF